MARTIADLQSKDQLEIEHVAEAIHFSNHTTEQVTGNRY